MVGNYVLANVKKKKKDTVIWLGDFNYRIELDRETTIAAVQRGDLPMLYESDQVSAVHPAKLAASY